MFGRDRDYSEKKPREKPQRFVDFLDEPTRIKFLREGIYVGPYALVGPGFERTRPWDLPEAFDINSLGPSELQMAIELGILTRETLTSVQQEKLASAPDGEIPAGTAASLMGKLAMRDSARQGDINLRTE